MGPTLLANRFQACPEEIACSTPPKVSKPPDPAGSLPADSCQVQERPASPEEFLTAEEMVKGQACSREAPLCQKPAATCAPGSSVFAPPSRQVHQITPPPKSAPGVRRSPHDRAITMAPMLRAKHMDILDKQYINDRSARADVESSARPQRSSSSNAGARSSRGRAVSKGSAHQRDRSRQKSCGPNAAAEEDVTQQRPLGPKAVMPLVRGQLRVQAEAARRDADKVAREARLKEYFRSRPSGCQRSKSQDRSSKYATNSRKEAAV